MFSIAYADGFVKGRWKKMENPKKRRRPPPFGAPRGKEAAVLLWDLTRAGAG
jgi:hypothetical protein